MNSPERARVELESVDCNLCHWPSQRRRFSRKGYQIVQCPNCSLWWVNPRPSPTSAGEVYGSDYFEARKTSGNVRDPVVESFRKQNARRQLSEVERHVSRGKLLEVGCAEGLFLKVASEQGWDVSGVELSNAAARLAQAMLPGKVVQGTLREARFADSSFDAICLLDVVEHFHDPLTEMKEIERLLRPGGVVFLLTPDCESLFARVMGPFWFEVKPDEHLYYFSRTTLNTLLRQAGLEVVELKRAGKTLTFEYIAQILDKAESPFGPLLRWSTRFTPYYSKPISFQSGFVSAIARKAP